MNETLDLVISGLGTQPLAFACFVLARMANNKGLDVQILEPRGTECKALAHVRIAKNAARTPIGEGEADVLLGLDPVDAIRALPYLKENGMAVINGPDQLTNEMLASAFPDDEEPLARLKGYRVEHRDTLTLAKNLGAPITTVTILLGMLKKHLPFSDFDWKHAIGSSVPRKTFGINMKAFMLGSGEAEETTAPVRNNLMDQSETKKDDECSETTM